MKKMAYRCIKCDCRVTVERLFQELSEKPTYVRCPICGVACMPERLHQTAFDAKGGRDWDAAFRWSRCPHAYQCELFDQYDHQCEDGQVMPKCLNALHQRAAIAEHVILAPEKQRRSAPRKIRSQDKSGQQSG